jgi:hypothetical protein
MEMKVVEAIIMLCLATLPIAESAQVRTIHADSRSILAEESTPPIQIALDQTGNKRVVVDVGKDTFRPNNDGDMAVEPGEIMVLNVTLKNNSSSSFPTIIATLKTDDTRVMGLNTSGNEINMASVGISVPYGSLPGNASVSQSFRFVKVKDTFIPLGDEIHFTLDIRSEGNFIGNDEFDVIVGSDIIVEGINVDEDLIPGGPTREIDVQLRNISADDIDNVEIEIDWSPDVVIITNRRQDIGLISSGSTEYVVFSTSIDAGFAGYIQFTIEISADNDLINIETFSHYFGMRTRYITYWITDDDNNNDIAEPDEQIELQIARWNLTELEAQNVEAELDTSDSVIATMIRSLGDYDDIPPYEVREARRDYEFTVDDETAFTGFPNFDTQGHTVEFTLDVEEDNEFMGQETLTMRIGGVIRYLPPEGFSGLMSSISDSVNLSSSNNGNGLPEPGETIEIEVTLTNISDDDVDDVEAELDSNDDVDIIDAKMDYDEIRDGREVSREYLFRIDDDFEGNIITFELEIWGRISGSRENLGRDIFMIPVWAPRWPIEVFTGTIEVNTNLAEATFYLSGPANYVGSGMSWTKTEAPAGKYTITYGDVAGYKTPSPETKTLAFWGKIIFSGGYRSIALFSLNLPATWNLISFPLQPLSTDPDDVLDSIRGQYNSVWAYDPVLGWSIYVPGAPSDLQEIVSGKGYWIKMNDSETLVVQGTVPESTEVLLKGAKWNLAGYCSLDREDVGNCNLPDCVDSVWEYSADTGWFVYAPGRLINLGTMKPGFGYWIKVREDHPEDCVWDMD